MRKPFPYRSAWMVLEPFVSFRFDPAKQPRTRKQKASYTKERKRVRDYFKVFQDLNASRQSIVYTPKNTKDLRRAQNIGQHPKGFNRFTVAFVPGPPGAKVLVRGKQVEVRSHRVNRVVWLFEDFERKDKNGRPTGERVRFPERIAARILKKDKTSKSFVAIAGEHETKLWRPRSKLVDLIAYHAQTYDNQRKWFHGVIGYRYSRQADAKAYRAARKLDKQTRVQRRRNLRRKLHPIRANER